MTDNFGRRIDRLSGSRPGFNVTVRGDRTTLLRIRFITDVSVTRQGFNAQYSITFGEKPNQQLTAKRVKELIETSPYF